ncbi:MAG: LolA-like outer membrane lipoprotein chaperone [Campylobacterota bacterium]|nr:LolA-like outer membrane lipoprotein chaperone [Campylobacterota bacterium]
MRITLLLVTFVSLLMGFSETINTFSADFEQRITDDQNKTLTYRGHVWSKRPNSALWHYKNPIEKMVYVRGQKVVIIEPDLEQVLMRKIDRDIDLLAILKTSKPLDNGKHEAFFDAQRFVITETQGVIQQIDYLDSFENRVVLQFSDQELNRPIDAEKFIAKIPKDYDIIK